MFISINQLAAAYEKLGFVQEPGHPFSVTRDSDGLRMFHSPFEGELEVIFVIEEAAVWDPGLADQLRDAIVEILDSE